MENQITISADELKRELEKTIHLWVERTFNFIQVQVLEKYCDNTLHEYIRNQSPSEIFDDWLNDCKEIKKIREFLFNQNNENLEDWLNVCNEMEKVSEFFAKNEMEDFDAFQTKYESIDDTMINSLIECFGIETFEKFKEWCLETYEDDIYEYIYDQENYPMWNTCFEFRDSFYNSEEDIQKCMSVGLGVIEGLDDFNNLVFMKSAGHSFYSAYWIPLYFQLFPHEAEKYAGINYSDL
jgi:hypothetical protein